MKVMLITYNTYQNSNAYLPKQSSPVPVNPVLHEQSKLPTLFEQVASGWQLCAFA